MENMKQVPLSLTGDDWPQHSAAGQDECSLTIRADWKTPESLESFCRSLKDLYEMPGDTEKDIYLVPVSGGADSTAMAILLRELFPQIDFTYLFTDTQCEVGGLVESLDELEKYLGKPIHRADRDDGRGLVEIIEGFGGYLPSSRQRYCTRMSKIEPFEAFLDKLRENEDQIIWSFVGIRADEPFRSGLVSHKPWIRTEIPFKELGITREDVYWLLSQTIGIPGFYRYRSRSGCYLCPMQKQSEWIGGYRYQPQDYWKAAELEKLTEADQNRFNKFPEPLWQEVRIALNHLSFPVPPRIDARFRESLMAEKVRWPNTAKRVQHQASLFEEKPKWLIYVGVEFRVHPGVGGTGVWWQEFISFSNTLTGIQRQLQSVRDHRLSTAECLGLTPKEVKEECCYAVYLVELPADILDMNPTDRKSYTWRRGMALKQLAITTEWLIRTLHAEDLKQRVRKYENAPEGTWRHENWVDSKRALERIREPVGRVILADRYDPPEKKAEEREREIPCFACTI